MPTKQLPPLTARQIELMWHDTFSTNNPFCPCDLKSFTKTVRATEGALAALLQAAPTGWKKLLQESLDLVRPGRGSPHREWNDIYRDGMRAGLDKAIELLAAVEPAAPAVQVQPSEPEYWQWRRKGEPWTLEKTFNSQVFATTSDSEVRPLYAAAQPEQPGDHVSRAVPTKDATGATSDRELLELAARAAGISVGTGAEARFIGEHASLYFHNDSRNHPMCRPGTPPGNVPWNPLADDGDAFRLAVRLRLNVEHIGAYSQAGFRSKEPAPSGTCAHGNDPYAATRRAVVRAAAQVEAQPEARKQNES